MSNFTDCLTRVHYNPHRPIGYCLFFVCACTVTDFSAEDEPSGVKFCTVVYRRPGQGIFHFGELCFPRSRTSDE